MRIFFFTERMAGLFYQLRRYRIAARYYHQALNQLLHCEKTPYNRFVSRQGNLDDIALSYLGAEMYDSAAYYCQYTLFYITKDVMES